MKLLEVKQQKKIKAILQHILKHQPLNQSQDHQDDHASSLQLCQWPVHEVKWPKKVLSNSLRMEKRQIHVIYETNVCLLKRISFQPMTHKTRKVHVSGVYFCSQIIIILSTTFALIVSCQAFKNGSHEIH